MSNPFSSFGARTGAASGQTESSSLGNRRAPQDGLSYVRGDTTKPLAYMTIPAMLEHTVKTHGPQLAVVFRTKNSLDLV